MRIIGFCWIWCGITIGFTGAIILREFSNIGLEYPWFIFWFLLGVFGYISDFNKCKKCGEVYEETDTYRKGYAKALREQDEKVKKIIDELEVEGFEHIRFKKPYYKGKEELKQKLGLGK